MTRRRQPEQSIPRGQPIRTAWGIGRLLDEMNVEIPIHQRPRTVRVQLPGSHGIIRVTPDDARAAVVEMI